MLDSWMISLLGLRLVEARRLLPFCGLATYSSSTPRLLVQVVGAISTLIIGRAERAPLVSNAHMHTGDVNVTGACAMRYMFTYGPAFPGWVGPGSNTSMRY